MLKESLAKKIVVVTGAGSGIGRETALLFARSGAQVVVVDVNALTGEETVELIHNEGNSACYINANLSKNNSCAELFEKIYKKYGCINILVNNAGILHHNDGDIVSLDEKVWDITMSVNVKSMFLTCKYAIPLMLQHNSGVIINLSSFVALRGSMHSTMAYSASKAAVLALTQDIAAKYGSDGIRCLSVSPGPTLTDSFKKFIADQPELKDKYLLAMPIKKFVEVEQIAKNILHLASDDASYIHGTNIIIDGGITSTY
jgi:NAD(P)-dependent dehydrogenase (short-subunit alcohol dehydrogenase family)